MLSASPPQWKANYRTASQGNYPHPQKGLGLDIENWHPITFLNMNYKLLVKAYAIRLRLCLGEVIHLDQSGFMGGRYISINVRTIADIIKFAELSEIPGWLLGCDFTKAFDSVWWDLI